MLTYTTAYRNILGQKHVKSSHAVADGDTERIHPVMPHTFTFTAHSRTHGAGVVPARGKAAPVIRT